MENKGKHAATPEEAAEIKEEKAMEEIVNETTPKEEETRETNPMQELQQKYDDLEDKYKRLLAEFQNSQKRQDKERVELFGSVKADVFEEIIPIVDNLEKAVETDTQDVKYKEGIVLIYNQMKKTLEDNGIEEIEANVGTEFNPSYHEAVSSVPDPELGEGKIKEVYRKGYKIGTKVLRHTMVVVSM